MSAHLITLALAASFLAACAAQTAREAELSTLSFRYAVPKAAPSRMVRTFERHCLDLMETPEAIGPSLEAADYVAIRARPSGGRQSWVVDDTRPAVSVIRWDGRTSCGVTAVARTGQGAAAERLVARRFPQATPLPSGTGWRAAPDLDILAHRGRTRGTPTLSLITTRHHGDAA